MGTYFIRMDDATDLRRKVLESSKGSINILRSYQTLLKTRGEKQTMIKSLRRELKELTMLVNRMEDLIPSLTKSELQELNPKNAELPELKGKPARRKKRAKRKPLKPGEKTVYVGKEVHHHIPKVVKMQPTAVSEPKEPTETEELHDKLSAIESKLGKL